MSLTLRHLMVDAHGLACLSLTLCPLNAFIYNLGEAMEVISLRCSEVLRPSRDPVGHSPANSRPPLRTITVDSPLNPPCQNHRGRMSTETSLSEPSRLTVHSTLPLRTITVECGSNLQSSHLKIQGQVSVFAL